ncbi:hypothetical protein AAH991_22325 [Microbispora sp. ZYX-F-249]|uniref:FHA domain-containing protein n=1 Tax=Microbispora maris TaxID=3144104 RepID=A0ABV0ASR5_9ACTN
MTIERHLGDGDRYIEIAALNTGRVMTDGARFTQPDVIRPGCMLRMPAASTDLDRPQPPHHRSPPRPPGQQDDGRPVTHVASGPETQELGNPVHDCQRRLTPVRLPVTKEEQEGAEKTLSHREPVALRGARYA